MLDKETLYSKLKDKTTEVFTDEECEWITYYESLKSRSDKEHGQNRDPLVGALVRDKEGHVLAISHRASGQEGNHAEYALIKDKLASEDLTDCHLFTTLEPCVDDSRSAVGKSCSSIICNSEIKNVHIGILDSNPIVSERGISKLFKGGIKIYPYSGEVVELIYNSCEAFRNPTVDEAELMLRFKKDVFGYFDETAVKVYLDDLIKANNISNVNFEDALNEFVLDLLRRQFVSFNAKQIDVNDSIKLLFYKKEHLPSDFNREVKIIDNRNPEIDREIKTLNYPLPILFHYLEENYKNEYMDEIAFREIVGNLIIHRSYNVHDSLGYITLTEIDMHFKNDASKHLDHSHLNNLTTYSAESRPGDGIIAEFFNKANYCERSKKGQKTFNELKDKISITVSETNSVDVCYKYF